MAPSWPAAASSSSSFVQDHPLFGQQDPADLATGVAAAAAAAARGGTRPGYATRSSTGTLPRNLNINNQAMTGPTLFAMGPAAQNVGTANGTARKKRRRYGPKPLPPYACFCGKVFKRHEHMLRHRATHDDQIKYDCHICGKSFRRQDVMHRHTMTHASRGRQGNKMRTTASASMSAAILPNAANAQASGSNRKGDDDDKTIVAGRKREQDHAHQGYGGGNSGNGSNNNNNGSSNHDMLEDPTLRVGLAEYPEESTSSRHNQDHHIAAAQLYSAYNTTRYPCPTYPVSMPPPYGNGASIDMGEAGYARSESFDVMTDYHSRMGSSMSPPPAFFASATGFGANAFEAGQLGASAMARPYAAMPMATVGTGCEYESKPHGQEAGHHYVQPWHNPGYGSAHGAMHMGASESDWSEQSPSGPSPHTFASPAWSQKAELMRRDGTASASSGTPLGLSSSTRQLSMDPALRWHSHLQPQQQQQQQYPQQPSQYHYGSPLGGGNNEAGSVGLDRSPAQVVRRRLSGLGGANGYGANAPHDAHMHAGHGAVIKAEGHGETTDVGLGLGLMSQSHVGHESGSLGLLTTPTMANVSALSGASGERMPTMHDTHVSPNVSNSTTLSSSSSPCHYLGAGMSSMHVSHGANHQALPTHASDSNKHGFTSMANVLEPFDSGSPLTEATGNASPHSHSHSHSHSNGQGHGYAASGSMHADTKRGSSDPPIDPHLGAGCNGYATGSSSTVGLHGGQGGRRW